jgi:hypothetical protein
MAITVYGAGFPDNVCTVTATCNTGPWHFPPSSNTGDITKGVVVTIECQNEGQYWNLAVGPPGSPPLASAQYNCSGGDAP